MASLSATVGIITSPFKRGLEEMRAESKKWGEDLKSNIAGALAFGAFTGFVSNFMSEMDRIAKISARFGQSTETMQRLGHVASLAGGDLELVAKVLTKLTIEAGKSADKFDELGINAGDFAAAGYDQQILMLADAYEAANGDVQKQIALMTLLGNKGQDILPLLATGAAELREQFAGVATVAPQVISAIEMMNDSMDDFTQQAKASLGSVIGLLAHLGAATAAVFQKGSWQENYQKNIEPLLDQRPTGGNKRGSLLDPDDERKSAAKQAEKDAQAAADLDAEMVKLARSRMDAEQKITDLRREQAEMSAKARDQTQSKEDQYKAAKRVLEIQQDIETLQSDVAKKKKEEEDKAAKKKEDTDKAAAKAEGDLADEQKRQRLDKMDPRARLAELKKMQKELNDAAAKDPDRKSSAEKKLDALKLNDAIDAAQKEIDEAGKNKSKPSVVSSTLASIGGGGRAYIGADPALSESRRQTSLLQQIAANTGGRGGSVVPASRNPF